MGQLSSSATWSTLIGKPQELPEGMSTGDFLDLIADIAENRYANSLSQENYDDVLFDVFVDSSKIASNSGVSITTGQNGDIKLGGVDLNDGFEDGDVSEWSGTSIAASTSTVINGSYSGQYDLSDGTVSSTGSLGDVKPGSAKVDVKIPTTSDTSTEKFYFFHPFDSGGGEQLNVRIDGTGSLYYYDNGGGGWTDSGLNYSNGTVHTFKFIFDWVNGTYDIAVDGTTQVTGAGLLDTQGIDSIELDAAGTWTPTYVYIDDLMVGSYNTGGSITSVSKSLSYSPSYVQITQDANIPADEDIVYDVIDSSSTVVTTIDQTEIGEDVAISTSDTSFSVKPKLSSTDGADTPILHEYGVMFSG